MILSEQEEKQIWESWLKNEDGSLSEYSAKLENIKKAVRDIYDRNRQKYGDLPFYTPHGPEHCQSVEDLLHKIISGTRYKKFSIKERYYMLAGAWLHDLGMLRNVSELVYGEELPTNEIRKRHHITSDKYIVSNWFDLKIDELDKEILGKLCRYHRRVEKFNPNDVTFLVGKESFRLTLIASYLRLADSLDIGASRTPAESYAICLAYEIPEDSKLHWIKSKLVSGLDIDADNHTITIQYKCPNPIDIAGMLDLKTVSEKIDSIINLVTEDLRDELSSIINIITRSEISYFLDIKDKKLSVALDKQMLNDLRELVINYDIMMSPSATKLIEIILVTVANILGYSLLKGTDPMELTKNTDLNSIRDKADKVLSSIENNIISNRSCHYGLKNLVNHCKNIINKLRGNNYTIKESIKEIDDLYQAHQLSREGIRNNAKLYFKKFTKEIENNRVYNILLYGYSELTTKAICGLRDILIEKQYNIIDAKEVYGSELESNVSRQIRIFICEGQPKTQTSYNDRLIYHDGSQYGCYLQKRGFNNIIIIPDIIAGTVIEKIDIDFIVLGANGVNSDYFTHSAGHSAIVNLAIAKNMKSTSPTAKVKIILVSTKEKYSSNSELEIHEDIITKEEVFESEGCLFSKLKGLPTNRTHIWLSRDIKLLNKLYQNKITFVNPREDKISINNIDVIITDTGFVDDVDTNSSNAIKKLFLEVL